MLAVGANTALFNDLFRTDVPSGQIDAGVESATPESYQLLGVRAAIGWLISNDDAPTLMQGVCDAARHGRWSASLSGERLLVVVVSGALRVGDETGHALHVAARFAKRWNRAAVPRDGRRSGVVAGDRELDVAAIQVEQLA